MTNKKGYSHRWHLAGLLATTLVAATQPRQSPLLPHPTQAQVARRFLREVVQGAYPAAYQRLAPEVQAKVPPKAFAAAAEPLRQLAQQRGQGMELYKLGTRLSSRGGRGQWFYSFSFANDSLRKPPPVLLEVTFRDTTARQVLGFGIRKR